MKTRGVYVRESFAGLTELLAIDGDGRTVRQLTVATALHTSHDFTTPWTAPIQARAPPARESFA
jgi:hypothetical protein